MKKISLVIALTLLTLGAWASGSQETASKPIVAVWYPNNSGEDWKSLRIAFDELVTKATGRPVSDKLTTDYVIAIEALASGNAAIAYPGAVGFLQAQAKNPKVMPLVVASGDSVGLTFLFGLLPYPAPRLPVGGVAELVVDTLLWVNIFWGLINLMPVFPLDGGQVARYAWLKRDPWGGVRKSLWLSVIAGVLVAVVGLAVAPGDRFGDGQAAAQIQDHPGGTPAGAHGEGMPELVNQDGKEDGRDPDQQGNQVPGGRAEQQGYQPEQGMDAHRDAGEGESQVETSGGWFLEGEHGGYL